MSNSFEFLFEKIGDLFRFAIIITIVMVSIQYVFLDAIASNVIKQAEQDGYFDYAYYNRVTDTITFGKDREPVLVESISPGWNTPVNGLGDKLSITVIKTYRVSDKVHFTIRKTKVGINHGYYGEGY